VLNPSPLKSFEREQKFGEIVADARFYTTFEEVSKYTDRMYLIENLYRDSTWLATNHPDDSVYVGYYNQEMSKNCGKVVQITKDVENNDYTAMAARNTSLNDTCSFTAKIKEVNTLFLNYWANDVYTFSAADEQFLHDLACSDAIDNGPAVYNARALLGLYVPCNNGFVKSAPEETEDIILTASPYYATVYPNPAQNIAYLEYDLADQAEFVLYDITGKEIQKIRLTDAEGTVTLPLENLSQGVYLYRILLDKEILTTGKLMINP
jgi:hypothetical protein